MDLMGEVSLLLFILFFWQLLQVEFYAFFCLLLLVGAIWMLSYTCFSHGGHFFRGTETPAMACCGALAFIKWSGLEMSSGMVIKSCVSSVGAQQWGTEISYYTQSSDLLAHSTLPAQGWRRQLWVSVPVSAANLIFLLSLIFFSILLWFFLLLSLSRCFAVSLLQGWHLHYTN